MSNDKYLDLIPLCSGESEFVTNWAEGCRQDQRDHNAWVERLIASGIKASHPDDGWVNRQENFVHFCYPHFDFKPQFGDLIALGGHNDKTRIVRVIYVASRPSYVAEKDWVDYYFEEVPAQSRRHAEGVES